MSSSHAMNPYPPLSLNFFRTPSKRLSVTPTISSDVGGASGSHTRPAVEPLPPSEPSAPFSMPHGALPVDLDMERFAAFAPACGHGQPPSPQVPSVQAAAPPLIAQPPFAHTPPSPAAHAPLAGTPADHASLPGLQSAQAPFVEAASPHASSSDVSVAHASFVDKQCAAFQDEPLANVPMVVVSLPDMPLADAPLADAPFADAPLVPPLLAPCCAACRAACSSDASPPRTGPTSKACGFRSLFKSMAKDTSVPTVVKLPSWRSWTKTSQSAASRIAGQAMKP
mmetsp:Transcript_11650/g.31259  ORF Transcript_11650/g.31259 Transcript_11650/m.31259 type:complete len:282 (+) Transcript_11650:528-1373(+)